jgi:hypothetical protein
MTFSQIRKELHDIVATHVVVQLPVPTDIRPVEMLLFTVQHPGKQRAGRAQLAGKLFARVKHTCAIFATQGRFAGLPAGAAELSKADAAA